ncbi:MAG: DUF3124 domain-containing protein [Planctomycetota bacterium]|nr:DUF3124 domain-containing protein [Planctomycetota bacterium]MDA1213817.1 DUF3124 domain-containing protein [Planctomycetota bacterium]
MNKKPEIDAEAFMRRFMMILILCGVVLTTPILIYTWYLNRRLDSFEETLQYRAPESSDESDDDSAKDQLLFEPVQGQTVYVPAYSHVYHENGRPHLLTVTLSVRNTSLDRDIVISSVRYFDTKGKEVKSHLKKPMRLGPLSTTEFLIGRSDTSGGSGANFIVEWIANQPVTEPIIETVMIDTSGQQGISFARSGTVIKEHIPDEQQRSNDNGNE